MVVAVLGGEAEGGGPFGIAVPGGGVDGGGVDAAEEVVDGVLDFGGVVVVGRCKRGIGSLVCSAPAAMEKKVTLISARER